ncbi:MAG: aldehyde dehydrogenase [Candidatus Aenigmarchaeota archaeon]|nr:aldehyde dehydrogenase [Candidatus Aenigmarchaeota archaeon]
MLHSINPATEEILGEVETASKKSVNDAVKKAKSSFSGWASIDLSERALALTKFVSELRKTKKELSVLMTQEMGKPITEAEEEIDGACTEIEWFAKEGKKYLENEIVEIDVPQVKSYIAYEPLGVAGIITPWNFPLETPIWSIAPALLSGNTVVWKPSELVPLFSKEISNLLDTLLPVGVFNLIQGADSTGKSLVDSKVNMLSFTGSSETGKKIASRSGKKLKKIVMELGGSDPCIILKDADIEKTVDGTILGRFLNCGQCCTSAKRFYVEEEIAEEFTSRFVEKTKAMKIGNPLERDTKIGPMASKEQLELLERQVNESVKMGAKVLCGGVRQGSKGYYYLPTVMSDTNQKMPVISEETFGPVAPIVPVKNVKIAVKKANDTHYGLGASIWTKDKEKAEKISKQLRCGIVWINDVNVAYPQCPWGGIKESGIGRELSKYGILEFVNIKSVIVK